MLGNKTSLKTVKKIEIISNIFSDHNGKKARNQLQEKTWKIYKYIEIKNMVLREQAGRGVSGCEHLSTQIHQIYTFRHRSACRTPAESGQEYLTSEKDPHKTQ